MFQRVAQVFLLIAVVAAAVPVRASAQAAPNPTQQSVATPQGEIPVFRVTVVGRSVPAINYRPRSGDTRINFAGTALAPKAEGWASVEGEKGVIEIDARFNKLEAPQRFGREYLTYVLWAITPEGRATNLGELQLNGDDGRLQVTTELQSFALVLTAEPYFAVSQPSDVVVMENVVRESGFERTQGRVETLEAKYELLKRGSYLMSRDPALLKVKPLEPGSPLDLAQARNAVELARIAGADRYASDTFNKAVSLLTEAETQREKGRRGNQVQQPARQAAQTAEDARLIALQRQEVEFQEQQQRIALERERDAAARLRAEEDRRRQAEADRLRVENERERAVAERAAAERERLAAERARADLERARSEADAARAAAQAQADEARRLAEQREREASAARLAREQAEKDRDAVREQLRQQLNVILETRETARGLIINLSDVLFDVDKSTLKPGAREKLARIAGILASHPDLKIEIEGHADSTGSTEYNQGLSERRAQSVRQYFNQQGVTTPIVAAVGFGETRPVATNGTAAGRQQNRRVEIIVSGESIGRTQQ
ncbi:MAG TPA: OmpA family protein [Vicinamibacterales bacterium]|jgi:outer membrane protein OmpA-like peptidoglycan-associated protein|nr:OmpA family protein [Vicinamibacterales bacterium]